MMAGKITYAQIDIKLKNVDEIVEKHAQDNADNISKKAPKRSGDYAKSFGVRKIENSKGTSYAVGSTNGQYRIGHILEFGTIKQKPQPHYRPAFQEDRKNFKNKLEQVELEATTSQKNI
jgi:HK97 gp10 family phage protein